MADIGHLLCEDKREFTICTEILKDAFEGYDFFNIYIENPKKSIF